MADQLAEARSAVSEWTRSVLLARGMPGSWSAGGQLVVNGGAPRSTTACGGTGRWSSSVGREGAALCCRFKAIES